MSLYMSWRCCRCSSSSNEPVRSDKVEGGSLIGDVFHLRMSGGLRLGLLEGK